MTDDAKQNPPDWAGLMDSMSGLGDLIGGVIAQGARVRQAAIDAGFSDESAEAVGLEMIQVVMRMLK